MRNRLKAAKPRRARKPILRMVVLVMVLAQLKLLRFHMFAVSFGSVVTGVGPR